MINFQHKLKYYLKSNTGNMALLFALTLPVILIVVKVAVDMAMLTSARGKLTDASDAAMLAGAHAVRNAQLDGKSDPIDIGRQASLETFRTQIGTEFDHVEFDPQFVIESGGITGKGTFSYNKSSFLAGIVGSQNSDVANEVEVRFDLGGSNDFLDIVLLIDNSSSMGIGATAQDQDMMYRATRCSFACHIAKNGSEAPQNVEAARRVGATLRLDVVKDAAIQALEGLRDQHEDEKVRIRAITFSNHVETLVEPTTDLDTAINKIRTLDLIKYTPGGVKELGGTYIAKAFRTVEQALIDSEISDKKNGESSRQAHIIFLSDGLESPSYHVPRVYNRDGTAKWFRLGGKMMDGWEKAPGSLGNGIQVFNPETCAAVKSRGYSVYTIQTPYLINSRMYRQPWHVGHLRYISRTGQQMEDAFKGCASSPNHYYLASEAKQISLGLEQAMGNIFVQNNLRVSH